MGGGGVIHSPKYRVSSLWLTKIRENKTLLFTFPSLPPTLCFFSFGSQVGTKLTSHYAAVVRNRINKRVYFDL